MKVLAEAAEIEAVIIEEPVVPMFYLIGADRSKHHVDDDGHSTERRHSEPRHIEDVSDYHKLQEKQFYSR